MVGNDPAKIKNAEAQISRYLGKDNRRKLSIAFAKDLLEAVERDLPIRETEDDRRDLLLDQIRAEVQGLPANQVAAFPRFERLMLAHENAKDIFVIGIDTNVTTNNEMGRKLTQICLRQLDIVADTHRAASPDVRYTFCFPFDLGAPFRAQVAREFWLALLHEISSETDIVVERKVARNKLYQANSIQKRLRVFCCDPKLILFPCTFFDPTRSYPTGYHVYQMPDDTIEVCPISRTYASQVRKFLLDPLAAARTQPNVDFEEVVWHEVYKTSHLCQPDEMDWPTNAF